MSRYMRGSSRVLRGAALAAHERASKKPKPVNFAKLAEAIALMAGYGLHRACGPTLTPIEWNYVITGRQRMPKSWTELFRTGWRFGERRTVDTRRVRDHLTTHLDLDGLLASRVAQATRDGGHPTGLRARLREVQENAVRWDALVEAVQLVVPRHETPAWVAKRRGGS